MKRILFFACMLLANISFAGEKIGYTCEIKSIRNSLLQLGYDYTIEIDSNLNRAALDLPWLTKGDKFVLNIDQSNPSSDKKIETLFTVRENSCDGSGTLIENSNPNITGTYKVDINTNSDKNKIHGKMGLLMMGKFSSETCDDVFPNVIVKFSCIKQD